MFSTDYLPESIIYLWKKLLINKDGQFDSVQRISSFNFFNDDDREQAQHEFIDRSKETLRLAQKAFSTVDLTLPLVPISHRYFHFEPVQAFWMIFGGLVTSKAAIIHDIHISPDFLRKRTIKDCFVEIDRKIFDKIERSHELTSAEASQLQSQSRFFDCLTFRIKICHENLSNGPPPEFHTPVLYN
ncbi:hypothetical protein KGQ27_03395 [Patescibacteria group bacterium]|nr:hypothetical protein [Patescibacteria group bacterium]MDE1946695.1 hypothetical protein [Patescibacteria group bacterium]MDE2011002.1 hypothetical protein [Patescibacteria group bacterium]MDE2233808.1 hypothetical protein [Patescibacteria group bacterium]